MKNYSHSMISETHLKLFVDFKGFWIVYKSFIEYSLTSIVCKMFAIS